MIKLHLPRGTVAWGAAVLVIFCLAGLVKHAMAQSSDADFKWFSGLDFADVKGRPYVRVATGAWSRSGNDPPRNSFVSGFLLATNGEAFTVLGLDLVERTMKLKTDGLEHERIRYEIAELRKAAHDALKARRAPRGEEDTWRRFGELLPERTELFVLAWGCWRNGLASEARDLHAEAAKMPSRTSRDGEGGDFRLKLENDLAHAMMWRAVVAFGEPEISRISLLNQFDAILTKYPRSPHHERAKATVESLRKMVAEDAVHQGISDEAVARLPVKDRVGELIFRLRNQNGQQLSQPGWCDIFMDWRGTTNTPAHQLVQLGHAGVPQLIAAIDDKTFTRSVGYHRNFYFSCRKRST